MRLVVCEALGVDAAWALAGFEKSPYKFNLFQSLAVKMGDLDSDLPNALCHGASTRVRAALAPVRAGFGAPRRSAAWVKHLSRVTRGGDRTHRCRRKKVWKKKIIV